MCNYIEGHEGDEDYLIPTPIELPPELKLEHNELKQAVLSASEAVTAATLQLDTIKENLNIANKALADFVKVHFN